MAIKYLQYYSRYYDEVCHENSKLNLWFKINRNFLINSEVIGGDITSNIY